MVDMFECHKDPELYDLHMAVAILEHIHCMNKNPEKSFFKVNVDNPDSGNWLFQHYRFKNEDENYASLGKIYSAPVREAHTLHKNIAQAAEEYSYPCLHDSSILSRMDLDILYPRLYVTAAVEADKIQYQVRLPYSSIELNHPDNYSKIYKQLHGHSSSWQG